MCTSVVYKTEDTYFGRTLDLEFSYGESVIIAPRNFTFAFCEHEPMNSHYAMVGMAHLANDYPLFYEAVNERGLGMAGLNFVGNAAYSTEPQAGKDNIAQFEFIPWILGQCANIEETLKLLQNLNLRAIPFSDDLPVAELHWMISDKERSITVEVTRGGMKVYNNPVGTLTNNPSFDKQLFNLNNYMQLTTGEPRNTFAEGLELGQYSRGMGALGLPGDYSSMSRFVKASFVKFNSRSETDEMSSVNQFFHILGSVDQPRGCTVMGDGLYEISIYASCCNIEKGIFYYKTYHNHQISAIDMNKVNLDDSQLFDYPLADNETINYQN